MYHIHGHWYYFDKIVVSCVTNFGMMPERWSDVHAHGISEEVYSLNQNEWGGGL